MFRKLFKWLSKYEVMLLLAISLFLSIMGKIVITGLFLDPVGFEEKIIWLILLVGSLLWLRIEAINISKIDYNDAITRIEKLYYDQCRFERAICEKFNVVYRQDENGLETFYDKDEYFENEYQKSKKWLEENRNGK